MARRNSKADILNAVEMTKVKPVTVETEVINEAGEAEVVAVEIKDKEIVDGTGTTTAKSKKTTLVEVAPGVVVELGLGRPVDPTSARQQKLAAQAARAASNGGTARLGRPSVPGSANAIKKAEMDAKKADPTYVAKRGRPVVAGSERQMTLAQKDEKLMARARQIAIEKGLITVPTDETLDHEGALIVE